MITFRPRWKKVLRDMGQHRARTLLVVCAIGLGLLAAGSVLNTYSILGRALREGYMATNPPSATLQTQDIDDTLLASVAGLPSVGDVQAERHWDGRVLLDGEWEPLRLFVLKDFGANRIGILKPEAGDWPPADGQLAIEQSSVRFARSGLGDRLRVETADGATHDLPITGVIRDSGLAPGWMEHMVYAFATTATLGSLGVSPGFDRLELTATGNRLDRDHVRAVASEVKTLVESTGRTVTDVWVPEPGRHIHAAQMDSLLYVQGAFGGLALFFSCILVFNLMTGILAGQVREIGVMKAVGASTFQIAGVYLVLTAAMGISASVVALPLAAWIGRAYADFGANMLNFDLTGQWPPPAIFLIQLAVGALLPVSAALVPIQRAARVTVTEALRDYGIRGDAFATATAGKLLARIHGPARPLLLSLRNTFRRRSRLVLTLLTMAGGGAIFLGALNLRSSISQTVASMFAGQRYDVGIDLNESRPFSLIEEAVNGVAGVDTAEARLRHYATIPSSDGSEGEEFHVTGLSPLTTLSEFVLEEGRWLDAEPGRAIVVNRRLAATQPDLRVGDAVTLSLGGRRSQWTLVGIADASLIFPAAYAHRDALAAELGQPGRGDHAVVRLEPGDPAAQWATVDMMRQKLEDSGVKVGAMQMTRRTQASIEDHFLMVASFLMVMALLIVAVGGFGLATTMSLAVMERTREIGVMRAIGATPSAVHRIVVAESLCLGFLAWLIAIPLSFPMSGLVGQGFSKIMFRGAPMVDAISPWGFVIWLAVVMMLSALAGLYPAVHATRRTTAEALAYN